MSLIQLIDLGAKVDERGQLVALEGGKNIPFEIKRVYYLADLKAGLPRGFHAHKNLQQVAVCVSGKCRVVLNDGASQEEVWLDSPSKGLFIGNMIWREMHDFTPDCVFLVLASEHYDEADYIRSYSEFKEVCGK